MPIYFRKKIVVLNRLWGEMQLERVVRVAERYKGGALLNTLEKLRDEYLG